MSRSIQNHPVPNTLCESFDSNPSRPLSSSNRLNMGARTFGMRSGSSRITALNIEFVAKPSEAHKVHVALPSAIDGALGEVDGFAGSFLMIANHEARLVTVVTLWSGEDRMQRCSENVRWVRALVAPYMDRCLRVQTFAAYVPFETRSRAHEFEPSISDEVMDISANDEVAACVV